MVELNTHLFVDSGHRNSCVISYAVPSVQVLFSTRIFISVDADLFLAPRIFFSDDTYLFLAPHICFWLHVFVSDSAFFFPVTRIFQSGFLICFILVGPASCFLEV